MSSQIKFCGLTRPEDVAAAASLGADYAGIVFAGGPRTRTVDQAAALFAAPTTSRRVGVFAADKPGVMDAVLTAVPLDVVQLHGSSTPASIAAARLAGAREVWAVVQLDATGLPPVAQQLFLCADAVVLDTRGSTGLGGTGQVFDWEAISVQLLSLERRARLIVAGGLTADNVARAIRVLQPAVVDVSSGVESAPGVKDHFLMRRFAEAARSA